jgi:hypothetical protein
MRLCGYCRISGHTMPNCDLKKEHRNSVLSHTPKERKALLDWMAKQGFGQGATLLLGGYYEGELPKIAIINNADWIKTTDFCTQKNKSYSKQVIIIPTQSYSRTSDGASLSKQWGYVHVEGFVSGNGESSMRSITLPLTDIANPKQGEPDRSCGYSVTLLSPSYEQYDVSDDVLTENVLLSKRLFVDGDKLEYRWSSFGRIKGIAPK